jgi:hypothetical protein
MSNLNNREFASIFGLDYSHVIRENKRKIRSRKIVMTVAVTLGMLFISAVAAVTIYGYFFL